MHTMNIPSQIDSSNAQKQQQVIGRVENESLIPVHKLAQFIRLLASNEKCDNEVLQLLSSICTEFVINTIDEACQISRLKESKNLEHDDIRLILEKLYNIVIPPKRLITEPKMQQITKENDVHLKRLAQIRQYHYLSNIPMPKSPAPKSK